jgi:hypothetical protein
VRKSCRLCYGSDTRRDLPQLFSPLDLKFPRPSRVAISIQTKS